MPLPEDFWVNEHKRLLAILRPRIAQAAIVGVAAGAMRLPAGITLDLTLANRAAAMWAAQYTDDLLETLGTTNQRVVGEAVDEFVNTPGATMGDLVERLRPYFGASRANAIAVTETTRAFAEGNVTAWRQAGITKIRWNTSRDDLVCKICGPLHREVVEIGQPFDEVDGVMIYGPPAHVNCRCTLSPVVGPRERLRA